MSLLACLGCGKRDQSPGQMSKAEFETWLAQQLKLTDVSLTEQGSGQFTGTGKKGDKEFQITATREARRASWEAKYKGPNSGESMSGSTSW